jgi:hypothetical protein
MARPKCEERSGHPVVGKRVFGSGPFVPTAADDQSVHRLRVVLGNGLAFRVVPGATELHGQSAETLLVLPEAGRNGVHCRNAPIDS